MLWTGGLGGCAGLNADVKASERLTALARRVAMPVVTRRPLAVSSFCSSDLAALSHSDGRILVSSGLMERLGDDELAAAIAHELGHLINDGQLSAAALSGRRDAQDVEMSADQTAVELLRTAGIDPAALRSMLEKVAQDRALSHEDRERILRRVERLKE